MTGEYLVVCCLDLNQVEMNQAKMRVMKEYKVQSSWTKLNVVLPYNFHTCTFLCFTKGGELVSINSHGDLIKIDDKELIELNVKNQTYDVAKI